MLTQTASFFNFTRLQNKRAYLTPIGRLQASEKVEFPSPFFLGILYHALILLASVVGEKESIFYVTE